MAVNDKGRPTGYTTYAYFAGHQQFTQVVNDLCAKGGVQGLREDAHVTIMYGPTIAHGEHEVVGPGAVESVLGPIDTSFLPLHPMRWDVSGVSVWDRRPMGGRAIVKIGLAAGTPIDMLRRALHQQVPGQVEYLRGRHEQVCEVAKAHPDLYDTSYTLIDSAQWAHITIGIAETDAEIAKLCTIAETACAYLGSEIAVNRIALLSAVTDTPHDLWTAKD